jgi:hypothetical protein
VPRKELTFWYFPNIRLRLIYCLNDKEKESEEAVEMETIINFIPKENEEN